MSIVRKSTLRCGIKVITEEVPDVESSTIGIWVRTGARNEDPRVNGVSHFIEHLLFKGTPSRTALDISREIESVGGVLNAFTGRETTCFYAKVLIKDLPRAVDLLSDMVLHSNFDPVEVNKEREVILHEIKMVDDTPDDLIHDLFAERFWQGHAMGRPVLGTRETIKGLGHDDIIDYYKDRYTSANIFICAAGGLKHDRVVSLLEAAFSGMARTRGRAALERPSPVKGAELVTKKTLAQVHLCLGVPVPGQSDPDRFKVYLMNTMLGGGMSSRLFQEIREKRGLAYSVFSYLSLCSDAGSLTVYAGTSRESFAEVVRLVFREFARMRRGVDEVELGHAREQLKGGMLLGLETSDNRMTKLARDEIYFGRPITVKSIVREIDRVTAADIQTLAKGVLQSRRSTLVALGRVSPEGLPAVFS